MTSPDSCRIVVRNWTLLVGRTKRSRGKGTDFRGFSFLRKTQSGVGKQEGESSDEPDLEKGEYNRCVTKRKKRTDERDQDSLSRFKQGEKAESPMEKKR